jgi:hypothetical protein
MRDDSVHFNNHRSFVEGLKVVFGVGQVRQALLKIMGIFLKKLNKEPIFTGLLLTL